MKPSTKVAAVVLAMLALTAVPYAAAASCTVTTSGEAFGSYNPPANVADLTTGTITVRCTGTAFSTVSYSIVLSTGSGTFGTRLMHAGSNALGYNLYTDSALTSLWGDGTSGTTVVSDSYRIGFSAVTRSYTVYGRIPNNQTAARTGSYSDLVLVSVNY